MNPDPAGTIDGLNLYTFVGGNPITSYDVGGMWNKKKRKGKKTLGRGKKKYVKKTVKVKASATFTYFGKEVEKPPAEFSDRALNLGKKIVEEIKAGGSSKNLAALKGEIEANANGRETLVKINETEQDADKFNEAFAHAMSQKTKQFESSYRQAQKGQDEFVSTSIVSWILNGVANSTNAADTTIRDEIKGAIQFISLYRMPTEGMGTKTSTGHVQHQSSLSSFYGNYPKNDKGEILKADWGKPAYTDRKRGDVGLEAGENSTGTGIVRLIEMAQAALLYSLTSGFCARPTASNVNCNPDITDAQKAEQNRLREAAKAQFPAGAASIAPDAEYYLNFYGGNCPSPPIKNPVSS